MAKSQSLSFMNKRYYYNLFVRLIVNRRTTLNVCAITLKAIRFDLGVMSEMSRKGGWGWSTTIDTDGGMKWRTGSLQNHPITREKLLQTKGKLPFTECSSINTVSHFAHFLFDIVDELRIFRVHTDHFFMFIELLFFDGMDGERWNHKSPGQINIKLYELLSMPSWHSFLNYELPHTNSGIIQHNLSSAGLKKYPRSASGSWLIDRLRSPGVTYHRD